ncbi:23710_t:CDS:2 [Gigaspora rosea]|nr:23710_t:CDS:2 [Gigaspora rosea]
MANELKDFINNFIEEEINNINNEGNEIIQKYEYGSFSNFSIINASPYGNVYTTTWENSTVVLKSITIDTSIINSEIVCEIKNNIKSTEIIPFETTINNKPIITKFFSELNAAFHEKWIESKVIEGKINEHNIDEFEDYKFISDGAFSKVYRARYKSTKNICALKFIEKNNHTNKELVNEPFKNEDPASLPTRIRDGLREKSIPDTPLGYVRIYKQCWQTLQDDRPSIEEVAMMFEGFIVQNITENDNFDIFDSSRFEEFLTNALGNINFNSELDATAFGQDEMTLFVYNLYSTFSNLFNEGKSVRDIIINYISQSNKSNEEVFQWLLANSTHPRNICLLGLFYRWNIGTDENSIGILNLFVDAANKGDHNAQYFAGRCYAEGLGGTDKDKRRAIEWYTRAAENKCAAAEHMLGDKKTCGLIAKWLHSQVPNYKVASLCQAAHT